MSFITSIHISALIENFPLTLKRLKSINSWQLSVRETYAIKKKKERKKYNWATEAANKMPVATGHYRHCQQICFHHRKLSFAMDSSGGMAARALFRIFSHLWIGKQGQELIGGTGKPWCKVEAPLAHSGHQAGHLMLIRKWLPITAAPSHQSQPMYYNKTEVFELKKKKKFRQLLVMTFENII